MLTKTAERSGVMVALYPPREVAEAIAQPGGEPAEEIHLTLLYLGKADELDRPEHLGPVIAGIAVATPPLDASIEGVGHFTFGPEPVTWASVDVPGLAELQVRVCEAARAAGFESPGEHGFNPHVTLTYQQIEPDLPNLDFTFDALALVIAGERHIFPMSGVRAADRSDMRLRKRKDDPQLDLDRLEKEYVGFDALVAKLVAEGHSEDSARRIAASIGRKKYGPAFDAAAHAGRKMKSDADRVRKAFTTELWKDDAAQIVYGVVMHPGVTDSQGDVVDAAEIEQAAHRYLAESRKHDVQHAEEQVDVVPVESFIAPADMEYAGRPVLKGSWVMAVHVADPEVWAQVVKGELTGFSIGGTAERVD